MLDTIGQLELVAVDGDMAAHRLSALFDMPIIWQGADSSVDLQLWDLRAGDHVIQVTSPIATGVNADRFIRRRGEGLYFCCFRIADFSHEVFLRDLLEKQALISGAYDSGTGGSGPYRLIWVHPKATHGLLVELGDCMRAPGWTGGGGALWWEQERTEPIRRVRQLVLVVRDLDAALKRWDYLFGLPVVWRFEDECKRWAVMRLAAGDTFLELRQPTVEGSEEAQALRRGEGPYLAMLEAADLDRVRASAEGLTVSLRPPGTSYSDFAGFAIDPSALSGARFEVGMPTGENPWPPAGPDWFKASVTLNQRMPAFRSRMSPYERWEE
jgi:hypothetical protein